MRDADWRDGNFHARVGPPRLRKMRVRKWMRNPSVEFPKGSSEVITLIESQLCADEGGVLGAPFTVVA